MRKLKLDLEVLDVQSFETGNAEARPGTVRAFVSYASCISWCPDPCGSGESQCGCNPSFYPYQCGTGNPGCGTTDWDTCANTCNTCDQYTCISCEGTCLITECG